MDSKKTDLEIKTLKNELKIQKELLNSISENTKNTSLSLQEIREVLQLIEHHEVLKLHKNKWSIVIYNLAIGILFAVGTVLGLFMISWFTYLFVKDSTLLKNIVENQMKLRNVDIQEIKRGVNYEYNIKNP